MNSPVNYCIILLTIIATTAVSCRKTKEESRTPLYTPAGTNINKELDNVSVSELQTVLEGKWYLLGSGGGISGKQFYTYSGIYHVFGKDSFTTNDNGKVTTLPCKWTKVRSIHSLDTVCQIDWNGNGFGKTFLRIVKDTLQTSDNLYDGFASSYLKIK